MKIFDQNYRGLEKVMDLSYKRHTVLTSNVANSETPNFRARELDFGGELLKALSMEEKTMQTTDSRQFNGLGDPAGARVVFDRLGEIGADGNNVDLDLQMGKLSTNSETYQGAINFIAAKLRMLRSAINRGGA